MYNIYNIYIYITCIYIYTYAFHYTIKRIKGIASKAANSENILIYQRVYILFKL